MDYSLECTHTVHSVHISLFNPPSLTLFSLAPTIVVTESAPAFESHLLLTDLKLTETLNWKHGHINHNVKQMSQNNSWLLENEFSTIDYDNWYFQFSELIPVMRKLMFTFILISLSHHIGGYSACSMFTLLLWLIINFIMFMNIAYSSYITMTQLQPWLKWVDTGNVYSCTIPSSFARSLEK